MTRRDKVLRMILFSQQLQKKTTIADRGSQIAKRSAIVSDHMETSLHEDGALRKRSSKPGEFENAGFSFLVWTENILKTELFENDGVSIITWFSWSSFPQTQIQNDRGYVFKFLRRSVYGKPIWCIFRVKPPFSNSSGVVWTEPSHNRTGKIATDEKKIHFGSNFISRTFNPWRCFIARRFHSLTRPSFPSKNRLGNMLKEIKPGRANGYEKINTWS